MSSRSSTTSARASRSAGAIAGFGAALLLAGCGDDPHFDGHQYKLSTSSLVLRDYGSSGFLTQPENWLFKEAGYVPTFCLSASTTAGNGARTVAVDWQGCAYGAKSIVGEFEYVGDGDYEGLMHVTVDVNGTIEEFDSWFTMVPLALPKD